MVKILNSIDKCHLYTYKFFLVNTNNNCYKIFNFLIPLIGLEPILSCEKGILRTSSSPTPHLDNFNISEKGITLQ